MSRKGQRGHAQITNVQRQGPGRLHGVRVQGNSVLRRDLREGADVLDGPHLVVGEHHGDHGHGGRI